MEPRAPKFPNEALTTVFGLDQVSNGWLRATPVNHVLGLIARLTRSESPWLFNEKGNLPAVHL